MGYADEYSMVSPAQKEFQFGALGIKENVGVFFVFHTTNTPTGGSQHNPNLGRLLSAPALYERQWDKDNC